MRDILGRPYELVVAIAVVVLIGTIAGQEAGILAGTVLAALLIVGVVRD